MVAMMNGLSGLNVLVIVAKAVRPDLERAQIHPQAVVDLIVRVIMRNSKFVRMMFPAQVSASK